MKPLVLFVTIGAIAMTGCATMGRTGRRDSGIDVVAHRGASAKAPENTLAAFRLAQELKADWFELDCTLTKDGEVICIHDGTVDRTTNAKGEVSRMALAELKKLDAGTWKHPDYAGEPLPTLAETLDFAKGKIGVYIEIKDSADDAELEQAILDRARDIPALTPEQGAEILALIANSGSRNYELTQKVIRLVRERKMDKQVVVQSFSPVCCAVAKLSVPGLRVEFLSGLKAEEHDKWEQGARWVFLLGLDGWNANAEGITPGRLAAMQAAGRSIAVWTVDEIPDMRQFAALGVNAIITNRPDAALRLLEELDQH
ncbi:MAG TPA: glycerophosphodiester phosphodiesterase family protein [Candidatus Hydrogenedentes bacterium]|nr:glycerophosphodiester phosphodiesterase family protein [Candidatus Hydrogenedentota bacterium]HQH51010.1 glycerophosphodiester phosphodiesterase family protein [Candidatus Hydrogenedentota bacterium]